MTGASTKSNEQLSPFTLATRVLIFFVFLPHYDILLKSNYFLPRKNHTIRNDTCRTTVWSRIFGAVYPANARDLTVHWCAEPLWAAKVVVKKSCHVFWAWFLKKRCARPVMAVAINQDGGRESGFTCMDRWCKQRDPKNDDGTPAHHEQLHFSSVWKLFFVQLLIYFCPQAIELNSKINF